MRCGVALCALVLSSGCDQILQLKEVSGCWDPQHMTHDEDGDKIVDGCDLCPADPLPQSDEDGDGVGDACDPHPGSAHDHLVFFDGFDVPNPAWASVGGGVSWQIAGDTAIQSEVASGYLILKSRTFHNATVITYFEGQVGGTTATPSFAGAYSVITDDSMSPPLGIVGDIEITDLGTFVQVQRPPSTATADFDYRPITAGTRARIAVSPTGECSGSFDDGIKVVAGIEATPDDGEIGLRTSTTSATFDSITVIETDP